MYVVAIQWQDGSVGFDSFNRPDEATNYVSQMVMGNLQDDDFSVADGYESIADVVTDDEWDGKGPTCIRMEGGGGEVVIMLGKVGNKKG